MPDSVPLRTALLCGLAMLAGALAPSGSVAAPRVGLDGGEKVRVTVCGQARQVSAVPSGGSLSLVVAPARTRKARRARRGSAVVVERCAAGRWARQRTIRLGARRTALRAALPTGEDATADLRVRTRSRSGAYGRAAYARIGFGEIVDVPVTFSVLNQNRTPIGCLPGPDGGRYPVHGTLVAPRSVLDAQAPAVTLYVHGVGYSGGLFFRLQDVPGYDYARRQAAAGHASVVLDRLGNPAHDDLPDGNASCVPGQADTIDQVVRALRAGEYQTSDHAAAFERIVLAGHSLGGFVTQVTQYSFQSADALAVISWTEYPSSLALTQFTASGQDCLTAPERSHGETGAPNYAAFGRTDADFAAAHLHNIEPAVATVVLAKRNRDPCGDFNNTLQGLAADHLLTSTIAVPVLVISGTNDALFSPPTNQLQAASAYPSSPQVTLLEIPATGHAVTLGRTHGTFRALMHRWLIAHGA